MCWQSNERNSLRYNQNMHTTQILSKSTVVISDVGTAQTTDRQTQYKQLHYKFNTRPANYKTN